MLIALLLPVAAQASPADDLYPLVGERLSLMRDVAAFKWLNDLPVTDVERESVVLEAAGEQALRAGLKPETAAAFFREQIEAAKDIQHYWFERWSEGGAPVVAPDLGTDIRPRLLALGDAIVAALGGATGHDPAAFSRAVQTEGLGSERRNRLFDALRRVEAYEHRLAQILGSGVLRVGTTGDYAPFSHSDADGVFDPAGLDVDLARDLARALEVELVLVQTSWPTLTEDLLAGRYDIAMSGVSRTLARARVGNLSLPYYVGGKMPIARCEDRRRFNSLDGIDQPDVRVIVNPGGTNEQFVDTQIRQAEKVLHPDNRTIFEALLAGEADVMITDSIEVALQARRNPGLCGTMGRTLTYQEKAYFMPVDAPLKAFVDTWLSLRLSDGTVNSLLNAHLE